tara:strand:- start:293 stop:526 length:234 start_codon:yes stop_codon:yes gene_type:complete
MATIRLNINEKVLDKVLWLLGHFSSEEVEIVREDAEFLKNKKAVQDELDLMNQGKATFISVEELDQQVRQAIAKHGN